MKYISQKLYDKISKNVIILCVDIIIQNEKGSYLLIKRAEEPLKGRWYTIGGRVYKGEKLAKAVARKVFEEVGLKVKKANNIGVYEDQFSNGRHSVGIVYLVSSFSGKIKLDKTSSDYKWSNKLPPRLVHNMSINLL